MLIIRYEVATLGKRQTSSTAALIAFVIYWSAAVNCSKVEGSRILYDEEFFCFRSEIFIYFLPILLPFWVFQSQLALAFHVQS